MIRELAAYEQLAHEAVLSDNKLHEHLFGRRPYASVLIAAERETVVGFALYFYNYSTFLSLPGIYLEDLFVRPAYGGRGHGKALLTQLAAVAVAEGCGRLEWSVLDWNAPSIEFYKRLGAKPMEDWTTYRLTGDTLRAVAAIGTPASVTGPVRGDAGG